MNNLLTISKIRNDMPKFRAPASDDSPILKDCGEVNILEKYRPGGIATIYVKKGEPQCIYGSILLGANSTWEISTALGDFETDNYSWTTSVTNGVASLGTQTSKVEINEPVTKIKCVGAD